MFGQHDALLIALRFRVYCPDLSEEGGLRRHPIPADRVGLLELLDLVETLICIELLHRAAVRAMMHDTSVVGELGRFAGRRAPRSDGEACLWHVRETFALDLREGVSRWNWFSSEEMDRDAEGLAFLAHWVARRFFPGGSEYDSFYDRGPLAVGLPPLPLVSVSLDTPWELVYEVPVAAAAIACGAIWSMVAALERLFDGEGAVDFDREELDAVCRSSARSFYHAELKRRGVDRQVIDSRVENLVWNAYMRDDDRLVANLDTLHPVTRLRLVAGRLQIISWDERVRHDF